MPDQKDQDESKAVRSAPAVRKGMLSERKLQPLSPPAATAEQSSKITAPDPAQGISVDITDNTETDKAVDAITSEEADTILENEDVARDEAESRIPKHRIRAFFSAWLGTKRGWKWTLVILFIVIVGLSLMPTTRYWILNKVGVRCSLSLNTLDGDTQLPLPGATVTVGSVHSATNHAGFASLYTLKLGPQTLTISRPGFATIHQRVTVGWGSNPLGSIAMKDVGQQYTVNVVDYVTGTAIADASASDGGPQTLADKGGKIIMTISGNQNEQPVPVTVSAPGYATKNISLSGTSTKPVTVTLAPSQKEVYISDQGGKYDLYGCYVDGTGKQLILPGTATETSNISLAVSPDGSEAALISTRDTNFDSGGALQQAMTLINVANGTVQTLDHASQVRLIGWSGSTVIYEEETESGQSQSYSIISYNYASSSRDQLASSSQFTDVMLAAGTVYYAVPASASTTGDGFYAIQPNGSGRQTLLQQDIWSVLRSNYTTFSVDSSNGWYSYTIGADAATALPNAPNDLSSIQYVDSPDGKFSAAIIHGQLQTYAIGSGKSQTITAVTGAAYPLRWLTDTELIYRVVDGSTSADYMVNVNGGMPKFITNVTNASGISG